MNQELNKLRWQCRRGMLELDKLLLNFIDHHASELSKEELVEFEKLLKVSDQTLYRWFMQVEEADCEAFRPIILKIINCSRGD